MHRINDNLFAQARTIFANKFCNINTIPTGWEKGSLLDIATYLNGLAMQKFRPGAHEEGLPVLKIKELRQGFCDSTTEFCSQNINSEYIIDDGDVIFSWSGSLLVDLWGGGTCGLNQHLFKVTSNTHPKWFYYLWTLHHLDKLSFILLFKNIFSSRVVKIFAISFCFSRSGRFISKSPRSFVLIEGYAVVACSAIA